MEANNILTADLLDLIFEDRNKNYGAYELRKHYQKRMIKALLITLTICILVAATAWLKSVFGATENKDQFKITEGLTITEIKEEKKPEPLPPPPPPPTKVALPKVKTIDYTTPIVSDDKVVEPPPTQDEIANTRISNITQDGIKDVGIVAPPEAVYNKGLLTKPIEKEEDKIFTKVEIDASYPGGAMAWKRFLERNLRAEIPVDNNAAPGTYTVVIEFVVDVNGKVSQIKPLTSVGYGMEDEAIRVIQRSGNWKPAIQNGREVAAYRKQPISFQVMEQ